MAQMNPRELDVLNILWKSDEPMMATDIVNSGEGLTQSTVTAVLRKLLKENLVEVVGITHSGRVLSRTYRPTEASRDVILQNFTESYNSFHDVISESAICAAILTTDKTPEKTKAEVNKLKALLAEYEKRLK
ncbi:MAG: BlaI/MecI/CopY family transcriptional regulator [Acetatifactor sp.]|nr:BlaI/MecI/CopY family transcriptional regulator [Acetatifactor sp.]